MNSSEREGLHPDWTSLSSQEGAEPESNPDYKILGSRRKWPEEETDFDACNRCGERVYIPHRKNHECREGP